MKRSAYFLAVSLSAALLAFTLAVYSIGRNQASAALPPHLGNNARNLAAVSRLRPEEPLEFVVFGDPQGSGVFGVLLEKLRGGDFDFMIILGDVAKLATEEGYRFFWSEIEGSGLEVPIFLVVGDNAISWDGATEKFPVDLEKYESWHGPSNFSFYAKNCLFILLNNVREANDDSYLDFLEKALKERRPGTRHTFACAHVPPYFSSPDAPAEILEDSPRFFGLLEKHKVDYCFSGHEHGYWRGKRNGVDYIKVAGGGGHLPRREGWGMFHHAMKFSVGDNVAAEDLVVVPTARCNGKRFRRFCCTEAYSFLKRRPAILLIATVVPALLLFLLVGRKLFRDS